MDNFFGNLFGTDSGFQDWQKKNQDQLSDQYGVGAGSQQAEQLARQDFALEQNTTGVPNADKGFDLTGLASDLFTSSEEAKKRNTTPMSMATNLTPHSGAGVRMGQAPQPMAQPMQQPMMQQPMMQQPQNTAMSAITQGFGKVPRIQQILQTLGYGR